MREHRRSFLSLFVEVALIAIAVFLGLLANNWHENREHRTQARAALRNFDGEMETNTTSYATHPPISRNTRARAARISHKQRTTQRRSLGSKSVHFEGVRPVVLEHTAWDLALATQALSYIKPDLAFDISKVYTEQNALQKLQDSFLRCCVYAGQPSV